MTVGEKIKYYRNIRGISQEMLGNLSGINPATIKKYEYGIRNPKPDQLLKITNALGISINLFMDFDIETVSDVLSLLFKLDEQVDMKFEVEKDDNGEFKLSFNYVKKGGILIVPSFDLYSNMVTGFMLRPTHPEQWMKDRHMKEIQLSNTSLIFPIPFGLTYYSLKKFNEFYVTEGHPDGLALPDNGEDEKGRGFFSIPGVNGLSESHLGLLRDKKVIICFDQDRAGQKSAYGYSVIEYNSQRVDFINKIEEFKKIEKINFLNNSGVEYKEVVYQGISSKLEKAGIEYSIKEWDTKLGSDINDVRIYGNINKLFN